MIQAMKGLILASTVIAIAACQDRSPGTPEAPSTSSTDLQQTLHCSHILGNGAEDIGEAPSWKLMESGGFARYQASDGRVYFPVPGDTCSIRDAKSAQ
jgi:hypothetical protein